MTVGMKYQKIIKYLVTAVCTRPLHIGSASGDKEEVLVHPVDGKPFIQAASLSGVMRQYYAKTHGEEAAEGLFGARRFETDENAMAGASRVRFSDGSFCGNNVMLELRPRVKIDPVTGTCDAGSVTGTNRQAGHKFNMEYIGAGEVFRFSAYLYDENCQAALEETLSAIHRGEAQFGGQKSNGCGLIRLQHLKRKTFDMTLQSDRRKWADEDTLAENEYKDILSDIISQGQGVEKTAVAYEVTVTGCTEGELLVKSIAVQEFGEGAPDSVNIRNAAKDYIVPGSSLKGAVRNQMERIASYIGNASVIGDTFGCTGNSEDEGRAGNIVFYDTVVGNREDNDRAQVRNRIHIDKFTGGVMHGGLFNEKNVSGNVDFRIVINDRNNPDSTCGLLLMALRDLAAGVMGVGGGYSVGKGIINVERIAIYSHKKKENAVIEFEKGIITDEQGMISDCIKAVQLTQAEEADK